MSNHEIHENIVPRKFEAIRYPALGSANQGSANKDPETLNRDYYYYCMIFQHSEQHEQNEQ